MSDELTDEEIRRWASHTDTALVLTRMSRALLKLKSDHKSLVEGVKIIRSDLDDLLTAHEARRKETGDD